MTLEQLAQLRRMLGLDEATLGVLREFHGRVAPDLDMVVEGFYVVVLGDERARAVMTRANGNTDRLRKFMRAWLDSMLLGPHDGEAYLTTRLRIGDRHVQVELPQDLMLCAMAHIRQGLLSLAFGLADFPCAKETLAGALCRIVDLELAMLLESYRHSLLDRLMATERLSTIGQLVASIGHELRNPLSTIETSAYLLAQKLSRVGDSTPDPQVVRNLEKIRHQVRIATKTVSDLLELAKNRAPRRHPVEINGVVRASIEGLRLPESVRLHVSVPEELVVYADADQLRIVLVNLLSNALDAVSGSGTIAIVAAESMGGLSLRVTDDGPGIPPQAREKVFQALYTTKTNGNGLGLPLCRRIAEAHGGCLGLEPSERGASFHLWLPGPESQAGADRSPS
ncbi:MAG: HAMP domain-containing sensor histidine kinase [Polyangiaceae bacterium]